MGNIKNVLPVAGLLCWRDKLYCFKYGYIRKMMKPFQVFIVYTKLETVSTYTTESVTITFSTSNNSGNAYGSEIVRVWYR